MRSRLLPLALVLASTPGCYHYAFEQREAPPGTPLVTRSERVPTFLNGFVGEGRVDTRRYCEHPVRTQLVVSATDVLLAVGTLLIYTPHTLSVTCPAAELREPARPDAQGEAPAGSSSREKDSGSASSASRSSR